MRWKDVAPAVVTMIAYAVISVAVSSCGWFTATQADALAKVIGTAAEIVKREHGKDLDELPMQCEHEYHPQTPVDGARILILCEAQLPRR